MILVYVRVWNPDVQLLCHPDVFTAKLCMYSSMCIRDLSPACKIKHISLSHVNCFVHVRCHSSVYKLLRSVLTQLYSSKNEGFFYTNFHWTIDLVPSLNDDFGDRRDLAVVHILFGTFPLRPLTFVTLIMVWPVIAVRGADTR